MHWVQELYLGACERRSMRLPGSEKMEIIPLD